MAILAVTGHMDLTDDTTDLVRSALSELLRRYADGNLVAVSCLAEGADSLFAEAALAADGRLVAVIPSRDYRRRHVHADYAPLFDHLLDVADEVVVLPYESAGREAYEAANAVLLERAERLVAVWNGEGPSGKGGGTADAVLAAREQGIPVDVVWPAGAARR
ncbi:hypothetical protein ACKI1I_28620 [Streptomyces turgidiscabies]|uniref:Uncharacterized protein n=1 Tax=Streptomyces turgidiscabies (strain Car8) TaxID=698760 RepID=L7F2X7_STRT8|nr:MULTISPECIES: hypothetical protein [Streptomyces]ELP65632.1 hypothetical protein STRTUCAR8_00263 [Streptomyces turgidiscabies Car8]MDX3498187.1 hypothetical protein [Streptomyces turgidiscabies]GAQ75160.1 hypothetical protein T45_06941 [Streptomyces turgidiscabies]